MVTTYSSLHFPPCPGKIQSTWFRNSSPHSGHDRDSSSSWSFIWAFKLATRLNFFSQPARGQVVLFVLWEASCRIKFFCKIRRQIRTITYRYSISRNVTTDNYQFIEGTTTMLALMKFIFMLEKMSFVLL